jgi:uncharacterized protein YuzE
MLISYEPNSDILHITLQSAPSAQTQVQGTVTVGFDAAGAVTSIAIPDASTVLWERGGQVNVMLPEVQTVVTQRVVERRPAI